MTNMTRLRKIIKDSGFKLDFVAKAIGLTTSGLYDKFQMGTEFKPSQVVKLCELLKIDDKTRKEIFLI